MAGENPFLNPIVLDTILAKGSLSVSDLKSFRLVCKDWFKTSIPTWRRTALLRLTDGGRPIRGREGSFDKFVDALDDPEKASFYQLDSYPFKQVRLARCYLSLGTFWEKMQSVSLEYLHFNRCHFVEPEMEEDLVVAKIVFEKCPNLKTLKVTNNAKFPKEPSGILKFIRKELLKSAQEGFQPHKMLEDVYISSGLPEKLLILLPLAENLKREVIVTKRGTQYETKAEDDADPSEPSTVGQRMLDQLLAENPLYEFVHFIDNVFNNLMLVHGDDAFADNQIHQNDIFLP